MDGTTIPSRPSGEMILAKTDYQWRSESIKTAFKTLAKTDLKIMKQIQTSEQQLADFFVELLVHRQNSTRQSGFCTMTSEDDHSSAFQPTSAFQPMADDYACGGSNSVLEEID